MGVRRARNYALKRLVQVTSAAVLRLFSCCTASQSHKSASASRSLECIIKARRHAIVSSVSLVRRCVGLWLFHGSLRNSPTTSSDSSLSPDAVQHSFSAPVHGPFDVCTGSIVCVG